MVYLSLSTVEMGNLFDKMVKVPESLKKEIDRGELEYKPDAVTYTRGTLAEPAAMDRDCVVSRFADAARFSVDLYYDAWWNTKEFKEMRTALDELSNLPKGTSLEETMAKCHELLEKTQHYIDLKKDAPETQRGRERLSFARRLRDICSDVIDDHRAAQLNEGDLPQVQPGGVIGQGDNLFQPQTVSQQMEERRELASMDMLHALRLNGRNGAVEPFARLLYYTKALDFVRENGEAASAGLLKEKTVNANMDRVMDLARTTLENMDEGELMYMIGEMAPARKLSAMAARTLGVEEPGRAMSQPQPGSERQMSGPGVPRV